MLHFLRSHEGVKQGIFKKHQIGLAEIAGIGCDCHMVRDSAKIFLQNIQNGLNFFHLIGMLAKSGSHDYLRRVLNNWGSLALGLIFLINFLLFRWPFVMGVLVLTIMSYSIMTDEYDTAVSEGTDTRGGGFWDDPARTEAFIRGIHAEREQRIRDYS